LATYAVAGAAVGLIGWSGKPLLLPVSLLFPFLFGLAQWRSQATMLSAAYFLAASSGLPKGATTFFESDIWTGIALWVIASTVFVAVHGLFWRRSQPGRATGIVIATIIMAVPPAGIVGWASPLTAAGILFPGTHWFGLAAIVGFIYVLACHRRPVISAAVVMLAWGIGLQVGPPVATPKAWTGIQTQFTYNTGSRDFQRGFELLRNAGSVIPSAETSIVLLPEGAAGWRTPTSERSWKNLAAQTDKIIYSGAEQRHEYGYDNVLVRVSGDDFQVVYRQRMPVPVSMWKPWSEQSTQAYLFLQPVVELDGTPSAVLICYEQLLIWPILHSRAAGADQIVGIANDWWARDTNIPDIQRATMIAWARLFNMPVIESFNT
jgi:hypothetical protein